MFPRGQRFYVRETNIASPTRFGQGERGGAKEVARPESSARVARGSGTGEYVEVNMSLRMAAGRK